MATKYAKKILEIIETSRNHMTAEQVFYTLRQTYPQVVLATVYNNLNRLWQQGLSVKSQSPVCRIAMTVLLGMIT